MKRNAEGGSVFMNWATPPENKPAIRENRHYNCWFRVAVLLRWEEALQVEKASRTLRDRLVIRLCLFVGMRGHEVADARVEHVDPVSGWIYIPWGHRAGPRYAAVDKDTLRLLAEYVDLRAEGPLVVREDGAAITRYIVYHVVTRTAARAGVKKPKPVCPLLLRHCFATTWLRKGGNIRLLQKQLGHKHLQSTAYYLDWLPDEIKAEHTRLFETFGPVEKWRKKIERTYAVKRRR